VTLPETVLLKDGRSAIVRRARPEDSEAWIAHVNAIGAEGVYIMTEKFTRTVEEIRKQFQEDAPPTTLWLAAEVDGRLVGGANFSRGGPSKNAHTASLGVTVRKEFRGLGLGEAMMQAGIAWARSVGVAKLKLGVFATNTSAIALYHKLGFVEEGRLKNEVILEGRPVDELLMARFL
jgi:RimJ/RimL family protein N-acetyltransferase